MKIDWTPAPTTAEGRYQARTPSHPRALTASAVRINFQDRRETEALTRRVSQKNGWQTQAWDYYDYIGEIKFSANLIANTLSKINIYPAYAQSDDSIPSAVRHYPEIEEYHEIIEEIFSLLKTGQGGIAGYLRTAALSQFIAGEHYLVREPANELIGRPEKYTLRSVDEIFIDPTSANRPGEIPQVYIRPEPEITNIKDMIPLPQGSYIARMWRPHPRYSSQADSAMRGVLDDADDLLTYSREGRILSRSRSTASLLFLPDSLDDSANPDDLDPLDPETQNASDDNADSVADYISLALNEAAIQDQHVNHYAPIILRGPADAGRDIRFIDLARTTDNLHTKMAEDKLDRILNALDIPKDLAKGLSDLKYNSGALIEDSLYNSHVEPLILLIVDQLTSGFLRPALLAQGVPPEVVNRVLIWYNPSAIMAKPAKAQSADFGYENGILSAQAWRENLGFTESDQPSQRETAQRMLMQKIALDPALASTLLTTLMPEVMAASRETTRSDSDPGALDALDQALDTTPASITDSSEEIELTPEQVDAIGAQSSQAQSPIPEATPNTTPNTGGFLEP